MKKAIRYGLALFAVMFTVALGRIPFAAAAQAAPQIVLDGNIGTYVQDTLQFSGRAAYAGGIDRVGVNIDGANAWDQATDTGSAADISGYPAGCTKGFSYKKDVTSLSVGTHVVTLVAYTKDGQQTVTQFCVTKAVPKLHVDNTSGATYSKYSDINITGWALNATGVQVVMVNIDGINQWSRATFNQQGDDHSSNGAYKGGNSSNFTYTIPKGTLSEGQHVVMVASEGNDGQMTFSAFFVNILGTEPKIQLDSDMNNSYVQDTLHFSGRAAYPGGIDRVGVNIDGINVWYGATSTGSAADLSGFPTGCTTGFDFQQDVKDLSVGKHTITLAAFTKDGKISFYQFTVVKAAPELHLNTLSGNSYTQYSDVVVSGWAVNATGMQIVMVNIDGINQWGRATFNQPGQDHSSDGAYKGGNNADFTYTIPKGSLSFGSHTILVAAEGNDGKMIFDYQVINVQAAPTQMVVDSDLNNTYLHDKLQFTGYCAGDDSIQYVCINYDWVNAWYPTTRVNRTDVSGYPAGAVYGYSCDLDVKGLGVGNHVVTVAAVGKYKTYFYSFIMKKRGPSMYVDAPVNGSSGNYDVTITGWGLNATGIAYDCVMVNGSQWLPMTWGEPSGGLDGYYGGAYKDADNSRFSYKIPTSYLHEGTNTVLIAAVGNDGQTTFEMRQFSCSVPLVLQLGSDINKTYISNQTQLTGYAANPTGINYICYDFDGRGNWRSLTLQKRDRLDGYPDGSTVNFSGTLNTLTLSPGNHTLALAAVGNDGRMSFKVYTVYYTGSNKVTSYNTTLSTLENNQIQAYPSDSSCAEIDDSWYYLTYQSDGQGNKQLGYKVGAKGDFVADASEYSYLFSKLAYFANPGNFYNYGSNSFADQDGAYMFMSLKYVGGVSADGLNHFLGGVLAGHGQDFINAGQNHNINPVYLAMHAIEETGNGTSKIAREKNNFWGINAYDSDPDKATSYPTVADGIDQGALFIAKNYINSKTYYPTSKTACDQDTLYKMRFCPDHAGANDCYCTDVQWAHNIAHYISEYYQNYSSDPLIFDVPSYN